MNTTTMAFFGGPPLAELAATGWQAAADYATDFCQRSLIFLDILRQSGNQQAEMTSNTPLYVQPRFPFLERKMLRRIFAECAEA
jgi:hypothetical protein